MPRRLGPYSVVRELGRGSMGVVYLAVDETPGRDPSAPREVAVKVIAQARLANPTARERFRREAKLLARVRHPNVLRVHDSGEDQGVLWYAMDVVKGRSLEDEVDRRKQLPIDEACRHVAGIARAVQAMHEHGILHRDLKPANVMLEEGTHRPLLADFGLAFDLEDEGEKRLTKTGHSVGTPTYMSPEQVRAEKQLDARVDVYGLGAILHFALTGREPFVCDTIEELVHAILERVAEPPSRRRLGVSRALDRACLRALSKDRDARHPSAAALADELERIAGLPPSSGANRLVDLVKGPDRARRAAWLVAAALGSALLVAGPVARALALRVVAEEEAQRRIKETLATELVEANRRKAVGLLVAARAHVSEGDPELGRKFAEDGLRHAPGDPRLLATHARSLIAGDRHLKRPDADECVRRAKAEAQRALAASPREPAALVTLAAVAFLEKDKEGGLALLRRAVDPALGADPRALGDAAEAAWFYIGPDERSWVLEQIDRALSRAPEWAHAWYVKARALEHESPEQAEQALTRALELEKDKWTARWLRARVRDRLGHLEAAREDYALTLERYPDSGGLAFDLGFVEERLGNFTGALELYDRAVALSRDGESWPMRQRRARLRRAKKDYVGAAEDMRKVLQVAPLGQYAVFLGECYLELGKAREAREAFENGVTIDGSAEAYLGVARCRELEAGPDDALSYLTRELVHVRGEEARRKVLEGVKQLDARVEIARREVKLSFLERIKARREVALAWLEGLTIELRACESITGLASANAWVQDLRQRIAVVDAHQKETDRLEALGPR